MSGMPVFYAYRLVHIHIPKTAGTAIETYFHDIGHLKWGYLSWTGSGYGHGRWYEYQHLSMYELRTLSNAAFDGYRSFAVVRDPYSRVISEFLWRCWIRSQYPNASIEFFDSFKTFLESIPKDIDSQWLNHMQGADRKWANFLIHVRPQYHYVDDGEGKSLVDDILNFESLDQDMARLLNPYGLNADRFRAPEIRDLKHYYTSALLDVVNEIYAKDFDRFRYEVK